MTQGLYHKYKIEKVDGTPVDGDAQYFVLRIDTDVNARTALRAYANTVFEENPLLAGDLRRWLQYTRDTVAGKIELEKLTG